MMKITYIIVEKLESSVKAEFHRRHRTTQLKIEFF
jgi:hypothetical protein